jgi:hypothetical protein
VAFSYTDEITTRDNNKVVRLVSSAPYRKLWGDRFTMTKTCERRIENNMTGFKLATSVGGVGTGERGDRITLDDPHNVVKAESALERDKTVRFFRESMSNRLNDERSAIVIIMQRLHENDVSGDVLARESNYCHCMIPMYFDPLRHPASADGERPEDPETGELFEGNDIGWIDPCAVDGDGSFCRPEWQPSPWDNHFRDVAPDVAPSHARIVAGGEERYITRRRIVGIRKGPVWGPSDRGVQND